MFTCFYIYFFINLHLHLFIYVPSIHLPPPSPLCPSMCRPHNLHHSSYLLIHFLLFNPYLTLFSLLPSFLACFLPSFPLSLIFRFLCHFTALQLIKSFDFEFGFCIPGSVNTWDAVYSLPAMSEKLSEYTSIKIILNRNFSILAFSWVIFFRTDLSDFTLLHFTFLFFPLLFLFSLLTPLLLTSLLSTLFYSTLL